MSFCEEDPAVKTEETCVPDKPAAESSSGASESEGSDPCTDPDFAGGDVQEKYRELCRRTSECKKYYKLLQECNDRVNSKQKTDEKCVEEVIDYFHCVDTCAAKRFFKQLK